MEIAGHNQITTKQLYLNFTDRLKTGRFGNIEVPRLRVGVGRWNPNSPANLLAKPPGALPTSNPFNSYQLPEARTTFSALQAFSLISPPSFWLISSRATAIVA